MLSMSFGPSYGSRGRVWNVAPSAPAATSRHEALGAIRPIDLLEEIVV
jgi:hypothetical protein